MMWRSLIVVCLLCVPLAASATSSRVAAMGGGDDYFEDVNNVLRWYGSVASYGGTALFEYGEDENGRGQNDRRAAVFLSELGADAAWGVGGVFLAHEDPDDVIRLAWGKDLGSVQIGLQWRLNWEWTAYDDVVVWDEVNEFAEDQMFGAGARVELGSRSYLDVAADVYQTHRHLTISNLYLCGTGYRHDTWTGRARLFQGLSERTAIVPLLEIQRRLQPRYDEDVSNFMNTDDQRLAVGLGWNHLPDADTMLVGSFTYTHIDMDQDTPRFYFGPHAREVDSNVFLTRFGVERRMLSWLTLRAGVWQALWSRDERTLSSADGEPRSSEDDGEDLELSLGVSLHIGPFDADLVFRDEAPFNFGSTLTQAGQDAESTWNKITLQYVF